MEHPRSMGPTKTHFLKSARFYTASHPFFSELPTCPGKH